MFVGGKPLVMRTRHKLGLPYLINQTSGEKLRYDMEGLVLRSWTSIVDSWTN